MTARLLVDGQDLDLKSTLVMGVVNASPESFSDGGRSASLDLQLERAASMAEGGADIIDVGGQSAITNQSELDADVEAERVLPIVEWVRAKYPRVLISVDTYRPAVAIPALRAGARIINDVSGLMHPELAGHCAEYRAALVVMHTSAPPKVRLQHPGLYADVVSDVTAFLRSRMDVAASAGLPPESIIWTQAQTSPRLRTRLCKYCGGSTRCGHSVDHCSWRFPERTSSVL